MEIKERIIEEATRMFHESGIKSVRMDDIATACGISKRTLYEIFADREALIRQSLDYHFEQLMEGVQGQLDKATNVIEEFRLLFWHSCSFRDSTARVMKDLIKFYPAIFNDFLARYHSEVIEINRKRFERGIEQGVILANIDTGFMAKTMTSYLYGLKKDFEDYDFITDADNIGDMDNKESRQPFRYAIMYFLRGLSTEKGRAYIDRKILGIDNNKN